jgi:hypothetical protein
VVDGVLWLEENRMIFPFGPAALPYLLPRQRARQMLSRSPTAVLLRTTDGFHPEGAVSEWYAVICRKFLDLAECNSKNRSQIKKGLERCVVEKVDAGHIADHAYDCHVAARQRYAKSGSSSAQPRATFRAHALLAQDFADVIDHWAVYHEGIVVGYAEVIRFGKIEAAYSAITYHPEFFKKCLPSHALVYTMNKYYLVDQCFEYVKNGFRAVWHPTGFQQFLAEHFLFERAHTNLYLHYRPWLSLVMSLPGPVKRLLTRLSGGFAALCKLDEAGARM